MLHHIQYAVKQGCVRLRSALTTPFGSDQGERVAMCAHVYKLVQHYVDATLGTKSTGLVTTPSSAWPIGFASQNDMSFFAL